MRKRWWCHSKNLMTVGHIEERVSVGRTLDQGPSCVLWRKINARRSVNMANGGGRRGDVISKRISRAS